MYKSVEILELEEVQVDERNNKVQARMIEQASERRMCCRNSTPTELLTCFRPAFGQTIR